MARERWDKRAAFVVAAIGSAIGLGNVWRFPYMAYSNGGGAFFIPYLIALITTGIPLISLEYYLGVRAQKGPTEAFNLIKKNTNFIGWLALGTAAMITFYYTVVMSWACNYMWHSIGVTWAGDEKKHFFKNVLHLSDSVANFGGIQWHLVFGNLVVWVAIFLIIFKGIKVVGKVVHWAVILPWVLLLVLVVRGVSLQGAACGLNYYLRPDFSQLLNPDVWLGAYGQIFFSLSLGFGIMIAYASYLPNDSDINTNAWIVTFANCITSYFAGFAVFSILGYLAVTTHQPVESVVASGPALAFITYPAAIAELPGGPLVQSAFGIMFFLMLFNLGLASAFSLVEAIVTSLRDSFNIKRKKITFWICLTGFLAGFLYTSGAGLYWLDIVDHWMNWGLLIVGLLEAVLVGWFCDVQGISDNIDATSEIKLGRLWVFSIKYITPLILFIIIISCLYKEFRSPYENYPTWALMSGGWVLLVSLIFIAFFMQNVKKTSMRGAKSGKFFGWLTIYSGLIASFYGFYTASTMIIPCAILIGSLAIGAATLSFSVKQKLNISQKKGER